MIKAPKVIVTTQACLWWGQELWAHPYTSMKWGARCPVDIGFAPTGAEKGPHEMRVWGRIVGVRSTEQSVFNQNVTFGVRIIIS